MAGPFALPALYALLFAASTRAAEPFRFPEARRDRGSLTYINRLETA